MTNVFTLFDTAIGQCAIVWTTRGIAGVQLPQPSESQTRARINQRFLSAVEARASAEVQTAVDGIVNLLHGQHQDLSAILLDLTDVPQFNRRVYALARAIAPGQTLTYGDIARRLGDLTLSRDVGQALGRNPFPVIVPCHRVLAAGARPGGFSANGGVATKLRMLAIEGAVVNHTPSLFERDGPRN